MKKSLLNLAVAMASVRGDYDYTLSTPISQDYRGKGHNKQPHKNNYKQKRKGKRR